MTTAVAAPMVSLADYEQDDRDLPAKIRVEFERGFGITRPVYNYWHSRLIPETDWFVVGRVLAPENCEIHDQPFLLAHQTVARSPGSATFWSRIELGKSLRSRILDRFGDRVRNAKQRPDGIEYFPFFKRDEEQIWCFTRALHAAFYRDIWLGEYLKHSPKEWVILNVPFSQQNEAKSMGAVWDWSIRASKVRRQADMTSFSKWISDRDENYPAGMIYRDCELT